jgi:hypothetical protein
MNAMNLTEISQKRLVKLAIRSAKEFIAVRGINTTTRKGSKELELLIKKIAGQSLSEQEQATQIGQNVGEKIVELSRQKAKNNLDKGVVRQLAAQKDLLSLFVSSTDKIPSTHQPTEEKTSSKAATPVMVSKSVEEVRVVEDSDEELVEDSDEEILEETVEEILEEFDEELVEDSDEEFEDFDEEILEDSDEELVEDPDKEFAKNSDEEILEDSDEDVLDKNISELQEESQEEQPVELSARSEAIAINSSQSTIEKEEEKQESQEVK